MWEREVQMCCCIQYISKSTFNFSFKENRRHCNYPEKLFVNTWFSKSFHWLKQKWPCLRTANDIGSPFFFSMPLTYNFRVHVVTNIKKNLKYLPFQNVALLYKTRLCSCITFSASSSCFWQHLFSTERKRRLRWQWIAGMKLEKYYFSLTGEFLGFVIGKPLHVTYVKMVRQASSGTRTSLTCRPIVLL